MSDQELLNLLRQKRAEIARREGKELFMVFSNATLELTVQARPQTKEDLVKIKGWGPKKIEKYGNEILDLIKNGGEAGSSQFSLPNQNDVLANSIFSVKSFLDLINEQLSYLGVVKIKGEVFQVNPHAKGYCFFSIKDPLTQEHTVDCFIGNWKFREYSHLIEKGMEVIIEAVPSVYKNGRFSLVIHRVLPYGEGAIKKAFEALKKKLAAKGYFDPANKKPVPALIRSIGLITSESGQALHDFLNNVGSFGFKISLLPVMVEGDYAESSIVSAIRWFNRNRPDLDVLVVIRGGGSLENLNVFNSEKIADAIFLSRLPIITGIGHDKDQTIADFVADRSFSTPTAVANFIRLSREILLRRHLELAASLELEANRILELNSNRFNSLKDELIAGFSLMLDRQRNDLKRMGEIISAALSRTFIKFQLIERSFSQAGFNLKLAIASYFFQLNQHSQKIVGLYRRLLDEFKAKISSYESELRLLNPEFILQKGYSIAYTKEGRIIKDAGQLNVGSEIKVKFSKGQATSTVKKIKFDER